MSFPKLNFKHDWTEWLGCKYVWVRGARGVGWWWWVLLQFSLKSQVKLSADCKRSWSSDPLSDLRSCDGTLHTNGAGLLFFTLKWISVPAAGSGKTAVLKFSYFSPSSTARAPTRINHFFRKQQRLEGKNVLVFKQARVQRGLANTDFNTEQWGKSRRVGTFLHYYMYN